MIKLSTAQQRTLDAIRAHGGMATPEGGGWWKGLDNERLYIEASSNGVLQGEKVAVGTTTIYSLERRGLLQRRMFSKHAWKDSYVISK
jgi:hypothetical protein